MDGYENSTTTMKGIRPELQLKYPMHYKDSLESCFQYTGKYCNNLYIETTGISKVKADAYGMIILPSGDTLKNVLRIYTSKLTTEKHNVLFSNYDKKCLMPTDSINYYIGNSNNTAQVNIYRWYAKGYRYPIFETINTIMANTNKELFKQSFFYPPQEHYYIYDDQPNMLVLKDEECIEHKNDGKYKNIDDFNYNFSYSYSDNSIALEYHVNDMMEISTYIYDIQGRIIATIPLQKYEHGYYLKTVQIPDRKFQQLLLRIVANGKNHSEIIIK